MKQLLVIIGLFWGHENCIGQQYTVNGAASRVSCNEYILTPDIGSKSGSVWNNIKIDLSQDFDFNFDVFLGTHNSPGADGIAFVLQPISTSVGTLGSGLGFQGIVPSVGVTLDTYQNSSPDNDPSYDHIAIQKNGDLNHNSANNVAGPISASSISNDIEDANWHSLHIIWSASNKKLEAYFDGVLRVSKIEDFISTTFSGNPLVYWGFTGSTGGESNDQRFRTALNPTFHFLPTQKKCLNAPITFIDSTISFAPITKFYWNFGDASPIDSVNLNPTHTYIAAGNYTVTQTVIGADGCSAINTQNILIGSKPIASFIYNDSCINNPVQFTDASATTFGTINNWFWDFDNTQTSSSQTPPLQTYTSNGNKLIKLFVKSVEGCESDTLLKPIHIYSRPIVDFTFNDSVCLGAATNFSGLITPVNGDVATAWNWIIDGTNTFTNQLNPSYTFATPGSHIVSFLASATGSAGCMGVVQKNVFVKDKPHAAIKEISICQSSTVTLFDSSYTTDGTSITNWWWSLGNAQFSNQQNPTVTYTTAGIINIRLAVSAGGCISDTLDKPIIVNAKPVSKFGYSNLLCEIMPIFFTDSSSIATGTIAQWKWIYNNAVFSTNQNSSQSFSSGNQQIKLVAISNAGCTDTSSQTIAIQARPKMAAVFSDACRYATVSFSGSVLNAVPVTNYNWIFGDGNLGSGQNTSHSYNTNGNYIVSLYATSSNGCSSDTATGTINIYSTNAFAGNDTIAAASQPVQLNASGGISYEWISGGGLSNYFIANPIATISQTTQYIVKAFTPQGCISYDTVIVKIYKGPDIYLPNAFTPNGDGLNDIFKGIPVGIKTFDYLIVYNRWGQKIFETSDYTKGWDGLWKGNKQENGIYIVMAKGTDFSGNVIAKKQTVMLIR